MAEPHSSVSTISPEPRHRRDTGHGTRYVMGLRLTAIAAVVMLLAQIGLGAAAAQQHLPAADKGAGTFTAVGRAFTNGPPVLAAHAALGLLLLVTALTAFILAVLARRGTGLVIALIGLAAVVGADITGARFLGSRQTADKTVMTVTGVVALLCYAWCLLRPGGRAR